MENAGNPSRTLEISKTIELTFRGGKLYGTFQIVHFHKAFDHLRGEIADRLLGMIHVVRFHRGMQDPLGSIAGFGGRSTSGFRHSEDDSSQRLGAPTPGFVAHFFPTQSFFGLRMMDDYTQGDRKTFGRNGGNCFPGRCKIGQTSRKICCKDDQQKWDSPGGNSHGILFPRFKKLLRELRENWSGSFQVFHRNPSDDRQCKNGNPDPPFEASRKRTRNLEFGMIT